uniref:Uncharacterized protein n=2 Tax=Sus scrofa TaxID=9823 RepID=A0A8D1RT37_PIG
MSYDPGIPLQDIHSHNPKTLIRKHTYPPIFIAAVFTTAKTWKQPKCLPTDEWIRMWYLYTMEYYSAIKKNEIMPFATT